MDPFIGEIALMAFDYPPKGWAVCDGRIMQIAQNSALFSILGHQFGGDGIKTFALPDFRGRVPVCPQGFNLPIDVDGTEGEVLITAHMPTHTHQAIGTSTTATSKKPAGNVWAATDATITNYAAYTQGSTAAMNSQTVANAGSGTAHSNMQPYMALNYCIAISGVYPTRP